jgi:chromate transporter
MSQTLIALAIIFTQLSVLAFGGGNTILPEMQRQVVEVHHWMTAEDFSALFALGQAAPGPNLMVVTLVGWHVAGFWGMLVTSLAKFGRRPSSPSSCCMCGRGSRTSLAASRAGWPAAGHRGAGGGIGAADRPGSITHGFLAAITAATAIIALKTKIHPLWLLLAGPWRGSSISVLSDGAAGAESAPSIRGRAATQSNRVGMSIPKENSRCLRRHRLFSALRLIA